MFKESVHNLEVALMMFMKMYGEESIQVASMFHNLGGTYFELSQYQKSKYAIKTIASTLTKNT